MFGNHRGTLLLAVAAVAAVVSGVAVSTAGTATDKRRHLTAQEICDAKPILIPCDEIDSVDPERRAALEEDAESVLKGRSPAEVKRETDAALKKLRKEHPIKLVGDSGTHDHSMRAGDISNGIVFKTPLFHQANAWDAPDGIIGGHKNSLFVYVGAAPGDPARGLLVRDAEGDTVPNPTEYTGHPAIPVALPGAHGRGAHIIRASHRGVLTIGFSNGSKLRYDAINDRFL